MRQFRLDTLLSVRGAAIFALFAMQATHAADPAAPTVDTKLPAQFSTFQAANYASMYGQCSPIASTGQALGNIVQGNYPSNPFNAAMGGGSCNGSESPPKTENLQCINVLKNGKVDEALIKKKEDAVRATMGTINCKLSGLNDANSQINCLVSEGQNVTRQVASMQASFLSNIQRFQADVRTINQDLKDRENQFSDAKRYIEGDGPSRPGLQKLKESTEQAVNKTVPDSIQAIEEAIRTTDKLAAVLEADIQSETISAALDCFEKKTDPTWRCVRNGPPVSAKEYILCRYQQNQSLGKDGVTIEDKQSVAADAQGNQAGLASLLDEIFANAPRKTGANNPQAGAPNDAGVKLMRSVDDIIANYSDALSAYNGKGLNISKFAVDQLKNCNYRAQKYVQVLRTHKPSTVYNAEYNLQVQQRQNAREANKFLNVINQVYTQDLMGLTGVSLPLNTTGCENKPMNVTIGCMQDLQKNLNGLLMGNIPNSSMNVNLKARTAANNINFTCSGIYGCLNAMTNIKDNLQREGQRITAFKTDYVGKANANIDQFVQQMATKLSPMSTQLNDKINALNGKLSALGVPRIRPKPLEPEQLQQDEDKLYKVPQNALAVIAGKGKMNPPLPDLSADGFAEGLDAIPKRISELNDKMAAANDVISELDGLIGKCKQDLIASKSSSVTNDLAMAESSHCYYEKVFCDRVSPLGEAGSILPSLGIDNGDLESETAGADEMLEAGKRVCADGRTYSQFKVDKRTKACEDEEARLRSTGKWTSTWQCNQPMPETGEDGKAAASCTRISNRLVKNVNAARKASGEDSEAAAGN